RRRLMVYGPGRGCAPQRTRGKTRHAERWPSIARRWRMSVPPPEQLPSVAVIVVNWNGTADTLECLASLVEVDYPRYEIIVVDNDSRPSPRQQILERFPSVTYLATTMNVGYAGGNNAGIRHALAAGHDYVLVLNNDTVVEPDVLRHAAMVAVSDPSIGAV